MVEDASEQTPKEEFVWEKFFTVGNSTVKGFVEREFFTPEYIDGYYVHDIVRDSKGDWVIWLKRSLLPKRD